MCDFTCVIFNQVTFLKTVQETARPPSQSQSQEHQTPETRWRKRKDTADGEGRASSSRN
jgi:hypothetical protein